MKTLTLLNVLALFFFKTIFAQSGTLDPTFGINGMVRANFGSPVAQPSVAKQTLEGSDKSLYILLDPPGGQYGTAISKQLSNGKLDSSYGFGGFSVTMPIYDAIAALQDDGKIVIAGSVNGSFPDYKYYFTIIRLNSDGKVDESFGNAGIVNSPVGNSSNPTSLLIQGDGKIVVAGVNYTGQEEYFAVARYNADGSTDTTFNHSGQSIPTFGLSYTFQRNDYFEKDAANAVVLQPDGKLLVAGQVQMDDLLGAAPYYAVIRYNTDGSFDSSFGDNGHRFIKTGSGLGTALGLQSDNKIILGSFTEDANASKFVAVRLNSSGIIDSTFGSNGVGTISTQIASWLLSNSMAIQDDDKIVMGSRTGTFIVVRFDKNGAPDNTFGNGAVVTNPFGNGSHTENSIAIQQDGKVIAAGFITAPDNSPTLEVARFNLDGGLDTSFNGTGKLVGIFTQGETKFYATAVQADGKVLAAGYTFNGTNNAFVLARYVSNGKPDSSFASNGVQITDITPGFSSNVNSLAIQTDGKIVVAGQAGPSYMLAVARYNADGSLDNSFNGVGYSFIDTMSAAGFGSLALQSDGKIVIGSSNYLVNNRYEFAITRLNTNGTPDTGFNHTGIRVTDLLLQANSSSVAIQDDGRILQAGIAYDAGSPGSIRSFALVRYNTDGSLDNSFGNNGQQISSFGSNAYEALCMALQPDGKIVLAGDDFSASDNIHSLAVARYKTNGELDSSFNNQGFLFSQNLASAVAIAIAANGKIALGGSLANNGSFGWQYSLGNFAVTVLNPDGTTDVSFGENGVKKINVATGTGTAGGVQSMVIDNDALFAAGFGTTPGSIGVITKYVFVTAGPLPVKLLDFTAVLTNKKTQLQWQTSAEYKLSHFLIERSGDDNNFSTIAIVKAKGTNGTKTNYNAVDMQPLQGLNYYRLQSIDIDGAISFSKIVKVNNKQFGVMRLYPNPAHGVIFIQANGHNEPATLQVIDGSGRVVSTTEVVLNQNYLSQLNIRNLSSGIYRVKIVAKSGTTSLQFIKQ